MPPAITRSQALFPNWEDYPESLPFQPIDIESTEMLEIRRWLGKSHSAMREKIVHKLHVAYLPPGPNAIDELKQLSFTDIADFESFLDTYNLDITKCPLIFLAEETFDSNNREYEEPRKHASARIPHATPSSAIVAGQSSKNSPITQFHLRKLWTKFCIHPMIMDEPRGFPGFRHQLVEADLGNGKGRGQSSRTYDYSYVCPMSWLSESKLQGTPHTSQHRVSAYSKIDEHGRELLAMFTNVRAGWVQTIIQSWASEQTYRGTRSQPLFLSHITLLASGLELLSQGILSFEVATLAWGEWRVEDRIKHPGIGVEHDVYKHRTLVEKLDRILLNLETFEIILQGLQSLKHKSWQPPMQETPMSNSTLRYQADAWMVNMFNKLRIVRGRLNYLSKRECAFETIILQFASYQKHNSIEAAASHIKQLADSNSEATREFSELTRETRHDAVLMKYLAEITVIFLPLTAVSTFFSMTFFSVNTSSSAVLPFDSLKYIWIFVISTVCISVAMYLSWWNKNTRIRIEKQRETDRVRQKEIVSETEARLKAEGMQRDRLEKATRLEHAALRYDKALAVEESLKNNDEATPDDLQNAQAESGSAIVELLLARNETT